MHARKSKNDMGFGKISDIGHRRFMIFGNIGAEWGRGGELWADTLGK